MSSIISVLDDKAGFFSMFFFSLNHYIYCKENNLNFQLNTDNWLYKNKNGWTDYFEEIILNNNSNTAETIVGHCCCLSDYSIQKYKNVIHEVYRYNNMTKNHIINTKNILKLVEGNYDSIFIRRGDKLIGESIIIPEEIYMNLLLKKNPGCNKLFIQTDDYNCYINISNYIIKNNLQIQLYTLCDSTLFGVNVHERAKNNFVNAYTIHKENQCYLNSIIDKKINSKSIEQMNSDEIYHHTINLISGIDIILNSNVCITDYQSNVSRFIKLAHKNSNNVFDIAVDNEINYSKIICPSYGF